MKRAIQLLLNWHFILYFVSPQIHKSCAILDNMEYKRIAPRLQWVNRSGMRHANVLLISFALGVTNIPVFKEFALC